MQSLGRGWKSVPKLLGREDCQSRNGHRHEEGEAKKDAPELTPIDWHLAGHGTLESPKPQTTSTCITVPVEINHL